MPRPWFTMLVLCAAVLTAASPHALQAQARSVDVHGTVQGSDGSLLSQVQVTAVGLGRSTLSDTRGRFVLRNVPSGRHRLHAALMGYVPAVQEVVVSTDGTAGAVALVLEATPLSLEGIQVTATTSGREPQAVSQATTQLSGKALERNLAGTIAQTLALQPGIRVRYNGPAAAMPVMRGLTGDRILILQDGQRASDLSGSATDHAVTIDPLGAQRIEVVRGPATLLYGNNALGGVVNVISDDIPTHVPGHVERVVALQTESAFPGASGAAKATVPLSDRLALTLRGSGRSVGDVRIGDDPVQGSRLENTESWNGSGLIGIGFIGERLAGGASVKGYRFGYGLPMQSEGPSLSPPDTVSLVGERYEAAVRTELQTGGVRFPSVRFDATAQDYSHEELDGSGVNQLGFGLRTGTANLVLRQGAIGPFTEGAWGVSSLAKQYASTGPSALTPAANSRAWGVFGFQEVGLGEGRPALQAGARLDHYGITSKDSPKFGAGVDRTFRAFSGSLGVRVPLAEGISANASVSRSFRAPTVEELFSGALHAGTGSVEYGTSSLAAERGLGAEGVLRVRAGRWNGQFVAYRNQIANYVYLTAQPDTVVDGSPVSVFRYVQDDATLQGVEGALEWAATPMLAVGLSGDVLHAEQRDGTPLSFMPPARAGGFARWDNGTFSLGADMHHELRQDRVGSADETPTDAHTFGRLDAGVRLTRSSRVHSITLRAENLSNGVHRESTSRIKDWAPNPGRNLSLLYRLYF